MNQGIHSRLHFDVECVKAPLEAELAWEVESLWLRIFEYGDYSFRTALRGDYADTLDCVSTLARQEGRLIGAAGGLLRRQHPSVAIVGPVGVHPSCRRQGIGRALLRSLVEHLTWRGCTTAYLGVSPENPAVRLYRQISFEKHHGIVMKLTLDSGGIKAFGARDDHQPSIRRACWGDFPSVSALLSHPGSIYTYDLRRGLFSSRYLAPGRFLSVFPEMMKAFEKHGGFANVLVAGENEQVMGIAQVNVLPSAAQRHVAELDFYVHDGFTEQALSLVERTRRECSMLSVRRIVTSCLSCDTVKQGILEKIGGRQIAVLPRHARVERDEVDVLVYELESGR